MTLKLAGTQFEKTLAATFDKVAGSPGFTATITSETLDRDGEVMIPQGCNTKEYERNPVLMCVHMNASNVVAKLPIGKCIAIKRTETAIVGTFEFAPRPAYHEGEWFPDYCRGLVEAGALSAVSVGADVMSGGARQAIEADRRKYGDDCLTVIFRWKLFEISLVAIPANPDALITAVHKQYVTEKAAMMWSGLRPIKRQPSKGVVRVTVPEYGSDDVSLVVREEIARRMGRIYL